jgi:hypothetical protein
MEYVSEGSYYLVTFTGLRTLPTIIKMLEAVEKNATETGVYKYLFDLRKSEEGFSLADKYDLGIYLARLFGTRYQAVVVMRKEHITGVLENVSANRGATKFMITDDEADARRWLAE